VERQGFFIRLGNQLLTAILRSPLHGLASGGALLITVTGRKSGKAYIVPVNYSRQGDVISIISRRNRTWWRNLREGAPITLRLQGRDVQGWGTVIEDDQGVVKALSTYVAQLPRVPRRYRDIAQAAQTRVMVQVKLGSVR
jgi:hypothetical protein